MSDYIRKENWKSDIRLAVTLLLAGEAVHVPDHAFTLRFRVCNGKPYYDCWRGKDGTWHNCKPNADGTLLMCFLDNHKLGLGNLHCEYYDYAPDADFADGDKLTVVPQVLPIELIQGAGDDSEQLSASVAVDLDGVIADANAAATAANAAAERANTAASNAETATEEAILAATGANDAATSANTAASAANAAAVRANDAAEAGMALCETAASNANNAASLANDAAHEASAASDRANEAAQRTESAISSANTATANANAAAQRAEDAAEAAEAAVEEVNDMGTRMNLLDAIVEANNYASIMLDSGGVNESGKGVSMTTFSNIELIIFAGGRRYVVPISANSVFNIPSGNTLYCNILNGQLFIDDTNRAEYYYKEANAIPLLIAHRGLVVGGKLYEAMTDYIHRAVASLTDGNFMMNVSVGDVLSESQMMNIGRAAVSYGTALKVGGAVADIATAIMIGKTMYYVRFYDRQVTITNGVVTAIDTILQPTELTQEDFDEICV